MAPRDTNDNTKIGSCNIPFLPHFQSHQILGLYPISPGYLSLATSATFPSISYTSKQYTKPHIKLHSTGSPQSALIGTADFQAFSSSAILQAGDISEPLKIKGIFKPVFYLHMQPPGALQRERFEWRNSKSAEVRELGGRRKGIELVRVSTGDVLVVYAHAGLLSRNTLGKLMWVATVDYGELNMVLVMMSLLTVLVKAKKMGSSNASQRSLQIQFGG